MRKVLGGSVLGEIGRGGCVRGLGTTVVISANKMLEKDSMGLFACEERRLNGCEMRIEFMTISERLSLKVRI